jgi:predicted Zn-dependent protease
VTAAVEAAAAVAGEPVEETVVADEERAAVAAATAVVAASSDVAPLAARSVSHSFRRLASTPASTSPLAATVDQNAPGVGTGVEGVGIGLPPFRVSLRKS